MARLLVVIFFLKMVQKKTLGVMLKGSYEFDTKSREFMEITSGKLKLKLKGEDNWQLISKGMNFNIPKESSFKLEILEIVNYICTYYED